MHVMTFNIYMRLLLESYQYLTISSVSEINQIDLNTNSKIVSFIISIVFLLLLLLFITFIFYQNCMITKSTTRNTRKWFIELFVGLRDKRVARAYVLLLTIRRVILVSILLLYLFDSRDH